MNKKFTSYVEKSNFKTLMDSVKDSGEHERMHNHGYSNFVNMIYKLVLGKSAKQFKEDKGLKKSDIVKDFIPVKQLELIDLLERTVDTLLRMGFEYTQIKERIENLYNDMVEIKKLDVA